MFAFGSVFTDLLPDSTGIILAVLWKVLAVLGGLGGAFLAIMGVLAKFDKLPVHLVMAETTMVLTRKGRLQQHKALLYTRKYRKFYQRRADRKELNAGAPYKKHTEGLVWFVPWYRTPEVFDHRRNTQSVEAIVFEKKHKRRWYQWKFPVAIASVIGKTDADIRKAWLAAQDRDENLRMKIGVLVDDVLRSRGQKEYTKSGLSELVTLHTHEQRKLLRLFTGIWVQEIMFPSGAYRTEVDAIRGLGTTAPTVQVAAVHQNGSHANI